MAFGFVGTTLDTGKGPKRWDRWRPSVALCQQDDLAIDRYELLHGRGATALAQQVAADVQTVSPRTEVRLTCVDLADPWDFEGVYAALHDFARAYPVDAEHEDYLVHITTGTHVVQICWFLLVEARRLPARLVQTSPRAAAGRGSTTGAASVIDLDLTRYDRIARRFADERKDARSLLKGGITTRNARFNALIERIEQVAVASRDPMLITGPTGAGKSQLARRIYELRRVRQRLKGPFVDVNAATLRGDNAMSTLFGHAKGAFTGALTARAGLLRQADGGVLFLDEVGELGLDEQAMLLRALEEKSFLPMGSDTEVRTDFQLVCGTNRDLAARVAEGRFREDLLARIDLWSFALPPLRERPEDVEPNLQFELDRLSQKLGTLVSMTREAREAFLSFATSPEATWPGNFRDFAAALTRLATLAPGGRIDVAAVHEECARLRATWHRVAPTQRDAVDEALGARAADIDPFDRVQLAFVLSTLKGARSLSDAGRTLFAQSRERRSQTNDADRLRKYLARFGVDWREVLGGGTGSISPAAR